MKNLLSSATVPSSTGRQVGMVSMWKPDPGQEDSLAVTNSLFGVTETTTGDGHLLTQSTAWKWKHRTVPLYRFPNKSAQNSHTTSADSTQQEHLLTTRGCQKSCGPQIPERATTAVTTDMQHHPRALPHQIL